jgi:hypothetical protein
MFDDFADGGGRSLWHYDVFGAFAPMTLKAKSSLMGPALFAYGVVKCFFLF